MNMSEELLIKKRYHLPVPHGWYFVAYADEIKNGESKPLAYFGNDYVLYRSEDGKPIILDAFCPHMGAHLGHGINEEQGQGGRVKGDTIICPFHAWRFNAEGYCVEVPYAKDIPPKARGKQCLKNYPVVEANKVIWMWYHPTGAEPMWDVDVFDEIKSDEWTELNRYVWTIKTHTQELAENGSDPAHFLYVHQVAEMPEWELNYDGFRAEGIQQSKFKTPQGVVNGAIHNKTLGPGIATTRFTGICETFLMGMPTPLSSEATELRFAFTQPKSSTDSAVSRAIIRDICGQVEEDQVIWENKCYREAPVLCDSDGPIAKFRKWYSQFYE